MHSHHLTEDFDNEDTIHLSDLAMEEKKSKKKKSEELFSSDNENRSNSMVDDIISSLEINGSLLA